MAVWKDPCLPKIKIPADLQSTTFKLGSARYQLLPGQFEFLCSVEEAVAYMGGFGSGKTQVGVIKSALISMFPRNRGIVGRLNATDLEETTQRDLLDFLRDAELLAQEPNSRNKRALVHCVDPMTGENLGEYSEISFQHLDDPDHLRGRHIGWFWVDEGSETKKKAFQNLNGRLRWPAFKGHYKALITGNPEGHNWIYDHFFNEDVITHLRCGKPTCKLSPEDCNLQHIRLKRRGIHATSYENYFLPLDYLENMSSSYNADEQQRYLHASFDSFIGQIFKEWKEDTHIICP